MHDLETGSKSYKPETSGALKTPMDWSHGSQKKANTMHTWQSSTLSEPFTRKYDTILDTTMKKNVKKMILHQFNTVQKCMGQRHTSKVALRLQEIGLDAVTHDTILPDEIYYSIVKQCTNNPAVLPNAKPSMGSDG